MFCWCFNPRDIKSSYYKIYKAANCSFIINPVSIIKNNTSTINFYRMNTN